MIQQDTENMNKNHFFKEYSALRKSSPNQQYYPNFHCLALEWRNKQYHSKDFEKLCLLIQEQNCQSQMQGLIGLSKLLNTYQLFFHLDQQKRRYIEYNILDKLLKFLLVGQWSVFRFESLAIIYALLQYPNFQELLINQYVFQRIFSLFNPNYFSSYYQNTLNEALWVISKMIYFNPLVEQFIAQSNVISLYIYILTNFSSKIFIENSLFTLAPIIDSYNIFIFQNKLQQDLSSWKFKIKYLFNLLVQRFVQPSIDQLRQVYKFGLLLCIESISAGQLNFQQFQIKQEHIKLIQKLKRDSFSNKIGYYCLKTLQNLSTNNKIDKISRRIFDNQFIAFIYKLNCDQRQNSKLKVTIAGLLSSFAKCIPEYNNQIQMGNQFIQNFEILQKLNNEQINVHLCQIFFRFICKYTQSQQLLQLCSQYQLINKIKSLMKSKQEYIIYTGIRYARNFLYFGEANKQDNTNLLLQQFKQRNGFLILNKIQKLIFIKYLNQVKELIAEIRRLI